MDTIPRMTNLFAQLGLDDTEEGIAQFIATNQLSTDVEIVDAPFWNEGQRQLIAEKLASDGAWTTVIDQLNEALHKDATE